MQKFFKESHNYNYGWWKAWIPLLWNNWTILYCCMMIYRIHYFEKQTTLKYGVFVVKSRSSSIFLLEQKHHKNSCERGTLEKDANARTRWNKTSYLKVNTSMFLFNDLKTLSKIVTFVKFSTPNLLMNLNQWPIRTHKSNRELENLCCFCCVVWITWSWIL